MVKKRLYLTSSKCTGDDDYGWVCYDSGRVWRFGAGPLGILEFAVSFLLALAVLYLMMDVLFIGSWISYIFNLL
jgi:hypothetical protein